MSDVQWLFAVVAALYVWECACWLRRGGVAFFTWLGRRWQALQPGSLVANQAGGFVLAAPLPPLGSVFVANQFPLSLSPDGVLGFVATNVNPGWRPAQTGRFVRFQNVREVSAAGRKVRINGEILVTCPTATLARQIVATLKRISSLKPEQRAGAIAEFFQASLDPAAVERRVQVFTESSKLVRALANGVVAYVFLVVPVAVWKIGFKLSWLWLLIGLLALTCATAISFLRAHRRLYPDAEDERFTHTLTILLAPTSAMRAVDALARPLLENFHPLAPAKALLPSEEFRQFAQRLWLDLQNPAMPQTPNDDAAVRAVEQHSRQVWQEAVAGMLKRSGLKLDALAQPPPPNDETCRAYCPRCQAQFMNVEGNCTDCGGLALRSFPRPA